MQKNWKNYPNNQLIEINIFQSEVEKRGTPRIDI